MRITHHAGHCCGIKTIWDFPSRPSTLIYEKPKTDTEYLAVDREGGNFDTNMNFFWEEAPREKAWRRLDRYLRYLEKVRHYGLVEVALALKPKVKNASSKGFGHQMGGEITDDLEQGELVSYEEALEAENNYDYLQIRHGAGGFGLQDAWISTLEKRGFKEVSRFPNSNSGNAVGVFHLVMDADYYKNKKKKKGK